MYRRESNSEPVQRTGAAPHALVHATVDGSSGLRGGVMPGAVYRCRTPRTLIAPHALVHATVDDSSGLREGVRSR